MLVLISLKKMFLVVFKEMTFFLKIILKWFADGKDICFGVGGSGSGNSSNSADDVDEIKKTVQEMQQLLFSCVFPFSRSTCNTIEWNISATDCQMKERTSFIDHDVWRASTVNRNAFIAKVHSPHSVWQMFPKMLRAMIRPIFYPPHTIRHVLDANPFYFQPTQQVH